MRWLHQFLSLILLTLAVPIAVLQRKTRPGFWARLGFYRQTWPNLRQGPVIWVHGASAGDMLALLPTCRALRQLDPRIQLIATSFTNSGHTIAKQQHDLFAAITYLPWDISWAVQRALRQIKPTALLLEYTELWPELIYQAERRGIQLFLHNGRIDERRMTGYRWLFHLVGNLLQSFTLLLMRSPEEAERAIRLGAPANKVISTGNTKFDNLTQSCRQQDIEALRSSLKLKPGTLLWVAGSTHAGEERPLLRIFTRLQALFPQLHLLIAPRYVERSAAIEQIILRHGHLGRRRSLGADSQDGAAHHVSLLDTIGELSAAYDLADVVFVGGSFVPRGGQNILEPAAAGKPVLFGPYMHNFADSMQVLLGRGGLQVRTWQQLEALLQALLAQPAQCAQLGQIAQQQVRSIQGAAKRNATLIYQAIQLADVPGAPVNQPSFSPPAKQYRSKKQASP